MTMNKREEIQQLIADLTPPYRSVDGLREVEEMLEDVMAEVGPHPLAVAAIKDISARIMALEIGTNTFEQGEKMALTQQEENVLRNLAQSHMPMQVTNPPAPSTAGDQLTDGQYLGRITDRVGKMPVVGGTGAKDDPALLAKTAHVRTRNETMGQFYSRTGVGLHQVLNLSKDELARVVKVSEETANMSAQPPKQPSSLPMVWPQETQAPSFVITD
jgi:hypothetical protein